MAQGLTLEQLQQKGAVPLKRTGGLTFQQLQAQQPVTPKETLGQKTARILDMFFGGAKVGEAIGTEIARGGATPEERQFIGEGPSKLQVAGSALQSASLFAPVGRVATGLTAGARALGLRTGASALGKIGSGLITGEAFDVATNLQEGKTGVGALQPGFGAAISGALPGLGVAKNVTVRFGEQQAPRIINSLIKPLAKDFSYGKNPGRAVAEEGIVANNFDDLATQIKSTRQRIGQAIGELGNKLSTKPELNIRESLMPINEAMKDAASQNNPTLLNRLVNVKEAITSVLEPGVNESGQIVIKKVGDRKLEGLTFSEVRDVLGEIGDMTQFTGNPSDDKLVNSALKQVYGSIKQRSLEAARNTNPQLAGEFEKLTEKYADLSSAEIATKYRDKIVERSNLVGFSPTVAGIGTALVTAIATGGATIPVALAGLSGAAIDKLASTPGFKTRLAALLSKKSSQEVSGLFQKIPALRKIFPKGSPISPGDRLLNTKAGQKFEKDVINYAKNPKLGMSIEDVSKGKGNLTTKFLSYIDDKLSKNPNATLSRQEILDFAKRPELKKGEADLLNRKIKEFQGDKLPAQEFADSIRRDLLELKPITLKEGRSRSPDEYRIGQASFKNISIDARQGTKTGKNYEEVVFESPITTNGSSHYPNSKNYFAHARGDEVVEGGKKIWREQEIQSDLLQKENLERTFTPSLPDEFDKMSPEDYSVLLKEGKDKFLSKNKNYTQLSSFTNDRFGERIMRERIREKAQKGYSKYRLPTGETISKIEGHDTARWFNTSERHIVNNRGVETGETIPYAAGRLKAEDLSVGKSVKNNFGEDWIITDILGDGRFKAVPKGTIDMGEDVLVEMGYQFPDDAITAIGKDKKLDEFLSQSKETFDLTGKSNPQYRRYEQWGKFLKNKYGGKEVIDPQGNTWVEIDLTKDMARMPIEAFALAPLMMKKDE